MELRINRVRINRARPVFEYFLLEISPDLILIILTCLKWSLHPSIPPAISCLALCDSSSLTRISKFPLRLPSTMACTPPAFVRWDQLPLRSASPLYLYYFCRKQNEVVSSILRVLQFILLPIEFLLFLLNVKMSLFNSYHLCRKPKMVRHQNIRAWTKVLFRTEQYVNYHWSIESIFCCDLF